MTSCIEFTGYKTAFGHGQQRYEGRTQYAHRVVWQKHNGSIPSGVIIRHSCDNPACVNVDHLEIGTHADNVNDCIKRGRSRALRGEQAGRAILTEKDVLAVRAMIEEGYTVVECARLFNIANSTASAIKHRKSWRHI